MKQFILKLSVFGFLIALSLTVKADGFFLPIKSETCINNDNTEKSDILLKLNDKAALLAVKSSDYVKVKALNHNEFEFTLIAYKIVDNALKDIKSTITKETETKICASFNATLDKLKVDEIFNSKKASKLDDKKIEDLASDINETLPKSIYENKLRKPLVYVEDLEYYNKKRTKKYTNLITEQLIFDPNILITEKKELADFYLFPILAKSSIDKIDGKNSRFSMLVEIQIKNNQNETVLKEIKSVISL